MQQDAAREAFKFKLETEYAHPGLISTEKVVVKNGPQAYKSASVLQFGDKTTGVVKHRELRVQTWKRTGTERGGYDFTKTEATWACENAEIMRVQAMLNEEFPETGLYQLANRQPSFAALLAALEAGNIPPEALRRIVSALSSNPGMSSAVAGMDEATLLAGVIERTRQITALKHLRAVVEDPRSTEPQIQKVLERETWIFGGRYVGETIRRSLVVGDQLDIPLIRNDGALHVVELKQANIPDLVVKHRNHSIVGPAVNEGVGQAMNYLRSLDEQRPTILTNLKVDCRRSSATVLIGHPRFVGTHTSEEIAETIRTYNSHSSRVQVMTYDDLLSGAERALAVADCAASAPARL